MCTVVGGEACQLERSDKSGGEGKRWGDICPVVA